MSEFKTRMATLAKQPVFSWRDWLFHPLDTGEKALALAFARKGADALSKHRPDAMSMIRPGLIDVADPLRCPHGQVYGHFANAPKELRRGRYATAFSFFGPSFPACTWAWQRVARERCAGIA